MSVLGTYYLIFSDNIHGFKKCGFTSANWWFSCSSIGLAGPSFITRCFGWVALIRPALSINSSCSCNWLVVDYSTLSWWLGQWTVHGCWIEIRTLCNKIQQKTMKTIKVLNISFMFGFRLSWYSSGVSHWGCSVLSLPILKHIHIDIHFSAEESWIDMPLKRTWRKTMDEKVNTKWQKRLWTLVTLKQISLP